MAVKLVVELVAPALLKSWPSQTLKKLVEITTTVF
jgi:hypothetical protein